MATVEFCVIVDKSSTEKMYGVRSHRLVSFELFWFRISLLAVGGF